MPSSSPTPISTELLAKLAERVDLDRLLTAVSQLSTDQLAALLAGGANGYANNRSERPFPPVNSDFYDILYRELPLSEQTILASWRSFLAEHVAPIANQQWEKAEFPMEIIRPMGQLWYDTVGHLDEAGTPMSRLGQMVLSLEIARVDPSTRTFVGVHTSLAMGTIAAYGSEAQKNRWLPAMRRFEKIGSFALTEPDSGSDAVMGLGTTAVLDGDHWVLNGAKKWSGNASFADVNIIWARNAQTGKINGFLVEKGTPGYQIEPLTGKISLRAVNNVTITLDNVRIPLSNRLPLANAFRDVSKHLNSGRTSVAWGAVGTAMGAYEKTVAYCNQRHQFGKPISSYQLVQVKLVRMLGNVTAMQAMMLQLTKWEMLQEDTDAARSSLAKAWCTERLRETVAMGRSLLGGNGILLEHDVARFFADAEAIYSYEGTYEMNTLIVGRAITGQSAFR